MTQDQDQPTTPKEAQPAQDAPQQPDTTADTQGPPNTPEPAEPAQDAPQADATANLLDNATEDERARVLNWFMDMSEGAVQDLEGVQALPKTVAAILAAIREPNQIKTTRLSLPATVAVHEAIGGAPRHPAECRNPEIRDSLDFLCFVSGTYDNCAAEVAQHFNACCPAHFLERIKLLLPPPIAVELMRGVVMGETYKALLGACYRAAPGDPEEESLGDAGGFLDNLLAAFQKAGFDSKPPGSRGADGPPIFDVLEQLERLKREAGTQQGPQDDAGTEGGQQ